MKKISFFLLAIFAMFVSSAQAQELKKTVLGVEGFTYSSDFSAAEVETVRNQIVKSIQGTGRVIVVDHNKSTNQALEAESERRKQESAMDANTVSDMTSLNANSVLSVHLDNIVVSKETYQETEYVQGSDGKMKKVVKGTYPYMHAEIAYTIKITDCSNGAVQAQETFRFEEGRFNTLKMVAEYTDGELVRKALISNCVSKDGMTILILNTFKAQGKVIQVDEGTPKKAKTVFISLGKDDGVEKKQTLEVFKEFDIAGEVSKKLIGEVEVIEILGASRCLAKVKKGGEEIQQILSAGGNVPVQSRDVRRKFFGGVK